MKNIRKRNVILLGNNIKDLKCTTRKHLSNIPLQLQQIIDFWNFYNRSCKKDVNPL